MSKKIIFYGGVQGIGKSQLLASAINSIENNQWIFNVEHIASFFEEKIKNNRDDDTNRPVVWFEEDWKKYDKEVAKQLSDKFKKENKINIVNCHFANPYKGKDNYVAGLELNSLENLLSESFLRDGDYISDIKKPCFGILLVDPEPSIILKHYNKMFFDNKIQSDTVLNYISDKSIYKDLEENRKWAYIYKDIATALLGKEYVKFETIYITKENKANNLNNVKSDIEAFVKQFMK